MNTASGRFYGTKRQRASLWRKATFAKIALLRGCDMKGQITIAEYFSYGACLRREGYTNTYDAKPEENSIVDVVDHEGNRFRTALYINEFGYWVYDATKGKGYDICWWKVVRPFNAKDKEKYLDCTRTD